MGRPKKVVIEEPQEEVVEEAVVETPKAESELDRKLKEQKELLKLREDMTSRGIDRLGILDAKLALVNQRIAELS